MQLNIKLSEIEESERLLKFEMTRRVADAFLGPFQNL